MTRFDDVAARAGAEVRGRFLGSRAPELQGRGPAPARRAVAIALVVVLAATGLVAVIRSARDRAKPAGRSAPMWQRIPFDGSGVDSLSLDSYERGFIAVALAGERARAPGSTVTPRIWLSRDGVTWSRGSTRGLPRFRSGNPGGVVSNGSRHLLLWNRGPRLDVYTSRDLRSWTRAASFAAGDTFAAAPDRHGFLLSVRRGQVHGRAVYNGYESPDGLKWRAIGPATDPSVATGLWPGYLVNGRYVTRTYNPPFPGVAAGMVGIYESRDRRHWTLVTDAVSNLLLGGLAVDRSHQRLFGIQFEPSPTEPGGRLMATRDGRTWSEITSFHERFPLGNPDHLEQSGSWWVLSGNRGGLKRQATMWATPDLVHWIELPRALRGPTSSGGNMHLAARSGRVVGIGSDSEAPHLLTWIWRRPAQTPSLVRVSGTWRAVGGPAPGLVRPSPGRIEVKTLGGKLIDSAETDPTGHFALDLAPGSYVLDGPCDRTTVKVARHSIHRDVLCQMK